MFANRFRPVAALAAALVIVLVVAGLIAAQRWRQEKLALLQPSDTVLAARPYPGTATGGLLLFGDSRVAQWAPLPERSFPITRHGHSGQSAIRLAATFEAALDTHRPQAAILQLGANDAVAASLATSDARDAAQAATRAAFIRMAQAAQTRGVALTIQQPLPPIRPPLHRRLLGRGQVEPFLQQLGIALPAIAATHGANLVDPLPLLGPTAQTVPDRYRRDTLHLTPAAYQRLNQLIPQTLPTAASPPAGLPPPSK